MVSLSVLAEAFLSRQRLLNHPAWPPTERTHSDVSEKHVRCQDRGTTEV